MSARKLQQEIDKCFKKVAEGVQAFESIYEKIQGTTNLAQKEKLEDSLKKEIKKLQRSRDQIKAWAAQNDIKDKKPLLDQRKLIEQQMEKFKAVEKEMKTKAYSKEGLSAAAKLDPKEKEKAEVCDFVGTMVDDLERQVETLEAELESLQANVKKGKKDATKSDRMSELEKTLERHKWHLNKLEMLLRALQNGAVEADQVKDIQDNIKYYVDSNQEADFMEDDTLYDDFNLNEEEDAFGMGNEADLVSSQDAQSIADELPDLDARTTSRDQGKAKTEATSATRRSSAQQTKSPLPALATLHTPSVPPPVNGQTTNAMKPAPIPSRTPGEPLKYASAAAAAASSDKGGVGIAPLPPPPSTALQTTTSAASAPQPSSVLTKPTTSASPTMAPSQPSSVTQTPSQVPAVPASTDSLSNKSPAPSHSSVAAVSTVPSSIPPTPALEKVEQSRLPANDFPLDVERKSREAIEQTQGAKPRGLLHTPPEDLQDGDAKPADDEHESIYHLPECLQDLLDSYRTTKAQAADGPVPTDLRLLAASHASCPDSVDAEKPRHYRPADPYPYTPAHYPQEPLSIFDDSRLYARVDTDTLFYAFYYRQGTYQQYLAAKALKQQSWRFHKQYQTWFQRHEEPKNITDEFEQGTYRFFDYESTW